jgi:hypothetical protein
MIGAAAGLPRIDVETSGSATWPKAVGRSSTRSKAARFLPRDTSDSDPPWT